MPTLVSQATRPRSKLNPLWTWKLFRESIINPLQRFKSPHPQSTGSQFNLSNWISDRMLESASQICNGLTWSCWTGACDEDRCQLLQCHGRTRSRQDQRDHEGDVGSCRWTVGKWCHLSPVTGILQALLFSMLMLEWWFAFQGEARHMYDVQGCCGWEASHTFSHALLQASRRTSRRVLT